MKKFICGIIALASILLPSVSSALILGPYTGQVIDSHTGEPVEGASVLIYWEKRVPTLIEGHSELITAKLVYTDNQGRYKVGQFPANLGLLSSLESTQIVIYQPGYQAYMVAIWHDSYSRPDPSFKKTNNIVKLDRVPPDFDHKQHYEKIESALRGIDVYPPYSYTADKGMPWEKVFEIYFKTHEKDQLLRRAEWEGRRGGSLSGVSCFPPDKEGYIEKWGEILRKGSSEDKVSALYNFPCAHRSKTSDEISIITSITNALKDKDPSVREEAVSSLIRIRRFSEKCCKETDIVPALIKVLDDESTAVRAEAAKAAAYYKDRQFVEPLIKALKDKDPWVRLNAVYSLGEFGEKMLTIGMSGVPPTSQGLSIANGKKAKEGFVAIKAYNNKPKEIRSYVPKHGELGADRAIDSLLGLLNDNSDWRNKLIQQECIIALTKMRASDERVISILIQKYNDDYLKPHIIRTLGSFNTAAATDLLLESSHDPNESIRKLAVEALSIMKLKQAASEEPGEDQKTGFFIEALKDPSAEVRVRSISTLGKLRDDKAIEPLIAALDDSSEKVRHAAAAALANFSDEKILKALIKHFGEISSNYYKDPLKESFLTVAKKTAKKKLFIYIKDGVKYVSKGGVIPEGAYVIERMVHPVAVGMLIDAANKPEANIKLNVLSIINNFEDERIEQILIELLDDPSSPVRQRSIALLIFTGNNRPVPKLIDLLKDNDENIRKEAARALGEIRDKRALEPLIERLNDRNASVREKALSSLGKFDDTRISDINIKMIQEESKYVKLQAIRNISEKPDKRAVELLIPLLNNTDHDIPLAAAAALGKCADKRAVDPLIRALKGEFNRGRRFNGDNDLRRSAAEALGVIRDKKAVPPLIEVVSNQEEEPYLRNIAVISLGEMGDPSALDAVNSLLDEKKYPYAQSARDAIRKIKGEYTKTEPVIPPRGVSHFRPVDTVKLKSSGVVAQPYKVKGKEPAKQQPIEKPVAEKSSIQIPKTKKADTDITHYVRQLKDKDYKVRIKAADALGDIGNKKAVKHLIPLLKDENAYVRQAAARALGKLKDKEAVTPLIESLKDDDEYVRAFSIWALGEMGDPRAVEPVVNSLTDKEEKVISSSYEALRKFKADTDTKKILEKNFIKAFESNDYLRTEKILYVLDAHDILKAFEDPDGESSKTVTNYLKLLESRIPKLRETGIKGLREYKDRALMIERLSDIIKADAKHHDDAIYFLKGLNDPECLSLFRYILENRKSFSAWANTSALDGIGDSGRKEDAGLLLDILIDTSENEGLRAHAARALGKLGDRKAVDPLITILKNKKENKDVRIGSAVALGGIKDKRAVETLIDIFKDNKEDIWLRVAAASALGDTGDERAIKPLEEKFEDPTGYLKNAVGTALRKLNAVVP